MDTWPISRRQGPRWTCIGIPDRLGAGHLWQASDAWPTLEEIAGEDWMEAVLRQVLPADRTWMWWTRSELYRQTKLPATKANKQVDLNGLADVVIRQFLVRRMTACFLPPVAVEPRGVLLRWAGTDTEQIPEH